MLATQLETQFNKARSPNIFAVRPNHLSGTAVAAEGVVLRPAVPGHDGNPCNHLRRAASGELIALQQLH